MICPSCGFEMERRARFCDACGGHMEAPPPRGRRKRRNSRQAFAKTFAVTSIVTVLAAILVVGGIFLWTNFRDSGGNAPQTIVADDSWHDSDEQRSSDEERPRELQGGGANPQYEVISIGRYDAISYIGLGRFLVRRGYQNELFGVYDVQGNEIISFGRFNWDAINIINENGFVLHDGRTIYVLDIRGNEITSFDRFDYVEMVTNNIFIVSQGFNRVGIVDAQGNEIVPLGRFTEIDAVQDGRWFIVRDINRIGVINASGTEVISVGRFDHITSAGNDRFIVSEGLWPNVRQAVLSISGIRSHEIIPLGRYDQIFQAGENHFIVVVSGLYGVLDSSGLEVIPPRYTGATYDGGFFIVRDGNMAIVYNSVGNELIPAGRFNFLGYAGGGHFIVHNWDTGLTGVIDSRGAEIVSLGRYDEIWAAHGNRFIVRSGLRIGVIDNRGNEIIPLGRYDDIWTLHRVEWTQTTEERIADFGFVVRIGNRTGVYGMDGNEIIPVGRYDHVQSIHGGIAIVEISGRHGAINIRRIPEQPIVTSTPIEEATPQELIERGMQDLVNLALRDGVLQPWTYGRDFTIPRGGYREHFIEPGSSLPEIARRYWPHDPASPTGIQIRDELVRHLATTNNIPNPEFIFAGVWIRIYEHPIIPQPTTFATPPPVGSPPPAATPTPPPATPAPPSAEPSWTPPPRPDDFAFNPRIPPGGYLLHFVEAGSSLASIARIYWPHNPETPSGRLIRDELVRHLASTNNIPNPELLFAGIWLQIFEHPDIIQPPNW